MSDLVSSRQYASEQAVLDEALELLQQRDSLRGMLQEGIDELDAGKRVPATNALDHLRSGLPSN
jgi:Arc/MetJ-type ribon-helix-helix transcriptional regulator